MIKPIEINEAVLELEDLIGVTHEDYSISFHYENNKIITIGFETKKEKKEYLKKIKQLLISGE